MSSRRLLVLLRHAPESGPYKTALREGGWTELEQMLAEIHKELALYRASYYAGTDNRYTPKVFINPTDRERIHNEAQEIEDSVEEFQDDIGAQLGWT